jgi:hypothetical protein
MLVKNIWNYYAMENEPCAGMSGICNLTREVTMAVLCSSDEADGIYLQDLQFSVFYWLKIHDAVFLVASPCCYVVWYFGTNIPVERVVSVFSSEG